MIHVCYSLRDESGKYSKFAGTSIQSLLDNTREEVTIHLIHDSTLSHENRKRFLKIVYNHDQEIKFYNIEELAEDLIHLAKIKLPDVKNFRGTIAALYRLLIPDLLPDEIRKIIYLDSDTIINLDIAEMWNIALKNFPIAAIPQIFSVPDSSINIENDIRVDSIKIDVNDYFNSGVLLLDLNRLRQIFDGQLFSHCIEILLQNPRNNSLDQDALNILFNKNFLKLPVKFNRLATWICGDESFNVTDEIYHCCGGSLGIDMRFSINRLWFSYFIKTPFCTPDSFENIAASYDEILDRCKKINEDQRELFQKILKSSLNRTRVFLVCPKDESLIFGAFGHKDGDVIIDATNENYWTYIFHLVEKSRGGIVFFICVALNFYPEIKQKLTMLGLNEKEDFFNGIDLVSSKRFVYIANPIVRAM